MNQTPLRAFLMMQSSASGWTVGVFRDLGALLEAWKARQDPETDVGVLHIGFDRPPSRAFDEVAAAHPGRMILTASAKFGVPASFLSSKHPIGVVQDRPVFLGLRGWGYTVDEASIPLIAEADDQPSSVFDPEGWVAEFLKEHHSAKQALEFAGIYNDKTYLDHEGELERAVRHKLGLFRTYRLLGPNCEDPCELAGIAPPWLAEREIQRLDLPVRANNVCQNYNIQTVHDLASYNASKLLDLQNFGRKSLRDILSALYSALKEGPFKSEGVNSVSDEDRLLTEIRRSLMALPDRDRDILTRRFGFETAPETLQEIADDYEVTRERIRQIEAKAVSKLIREAFWDDILEQQITQLLIGRDYPLPVAGIEAIDHWFEGISSHVTALSNILKTICANRVGVLQVNGIDYFSLIGQETWEKTIDEARSLLSSGAGQGWSEDYARSLVCGLLPSNGREFSPLLWDAATTLCHFHQDEDGRRIFTSYGRGAEQVVEAVLSEASAPLHYTKIAELASARAGKDFDARRAHIAAASVGYLFGRGTYGLERHLPLSRSEMEKIRGEAEGIVCSDESERQWHTSEILSEINETDDTSIQGLDKYVLNIALRESSVLKPLGRMTWARSDQNVDASTRIDIHQAIVSLVKAAGHPLTTSQIKEQLLAVRGVNEFFQISPTDPLIRIQSGLWGINDRDVPFSRDQQPALIEKLILALEDCQCGLHATELPSRLDLQGSPPDALMSIAAQDSRLKLSMGKYIYLSKWGGPRRETVAQAVHNVLESCSAPINIEQITAQVEERIGRKCNRGVISGALQAQEAHYDEVAKGWARTEAAEVDEDDEPTAECEESKINPAREASA